MGLEAIGERGARTRGALRFEHPLLVDQSWPYVSVRGTAPGPTISITAGMHGSEYAGIEAALLLAESLDPAAVRGHVVILPVINQPAFWARAAGVVPTDGKNPSGVFPGRRDGTVTEAMAAFLFDEVFSRCDALIDLHGGDVMERLLPFTIVQDTDDAAFNDRAVALAASYGLARVVRRSKEVLRRAVPGYLLAAAALRGIPGIVAEAGGEDQAKPADVEIHLTGLQSALMHLGALPGPPRTQPPLHFVEFSLVFAPRTGVFRRYVDIGEQVRAGQVLGQLRDLWGQPLEDVRAPADAEVLFLDTSLAARERQLLFGLGVPLPAQ